MDHHIAYMYGSVTMVAVSVGEDTRTGCFTDDYHSTKTTTTDTVSHLMLVRVGTDGSSYPTGVHGYAVTAHRSQGKSVDTVVISADGMRKELFYVAASRGREGITIVTGDKELLRESVARSEGRQSASELSRKAGQPALEEKGLRPSLREHNLRGLAATSKQQRNAAQEVAGPSRKAPAPGTEQTISQENTTGGQKQEHIVEPDHYHGISL